MSSAFPALCQKKKKKKKKKRTTLCCTSGKGRGTEEGEGEQGANALERGGGWISQDTDSSGADRAAAAEG